MPTNAALLGGVPFFRLLDDQERAALARVIDEVVIPAGQTIFEYGDPGDSLYVIRSGEVEAFVNDDTGTRIVLETSGPGEFFGEISLLDQGPRTATVVVTKDLEALRVDRDDLDQFLSHHPTAALDLLTVVGHRLRETGNLLRHTASRNVNEEMADTRTPLLKAVDWIAEFSGSIPFLFLNAALFASWILVNAGLIPFIGPFDPFPFILLTMAVSLEAIMLSVLVLLSQNRQAAKDHLRDDIEYEVNMKAELEVAHLHGKVDHLNASMAGRLDRLEKLLTRRQVAE